MGYMRAIGMIEGAGLDVALEDHMAHGCYPPLPSGLAGTFKSAILYVAEGDADEMIDLPEGFQFRGRGQASALEIVESARLDAFVDAMIYEQRGYEEEVEDEG
jgi:hypothetical protein